jgi:hypothetical protein
VTGVVVVVSHLSETASVDAHGTDRKILGKRADGKS